MTDDTYAHTDTHLRIYRHIELHAFTDKKNGDELKEKEVTRSLLRRLRKKQHRHRIEE